VSKKRYLYHCSMTDHGSSLLARKITPSRSKHEPVTPRLCAATSVPNCIGARLFNAGVFVYRTARPVRGVTPVNVWDSEVVQERWILPGNTLDRIGFIPVDVIRLCTDPIRRYHTLTRKPCNHLLRLAGIVLAYHNVPAEFNDVVLRDRYQQLWTQTVADVCPATFIHQLTDLTIKRASND